MQTYAQAFEKVRRESAIAEAVQDFPILRTYASESARRLYFALRSVPQPDRVRIGVALVTRAPNCELHDDHSEAGKLCRQFAVRHNSHNEFVLRAAAEQPVALDEPIVETAELKELARSLFQLESAFRSPDHLVSRVTFRKLLFPGLKEKFAGGKQLGANEYSWPFTYKSVSGEFEFDFGGWWHFRETLRFQSPEGDLKYKTSFARFLGYGLLGWDSVHERQLVTAVQGAVTVAENHFNTMRRIVDLASKH